MECNEVVAEALRSNDMVEVVAQRIAYDDLYKMQLPPTFEDRVLARLILQAINAALPGSGVSE